VALAGGIGSFLVGVIVEIFGSDEYFMVMGINLVVFVALPVWFLAKVFAVQPPRRRSSSSGICAD
jgi:hypothetical protein